MPPQPLSPGWQAVYRCQQYADSNKMTPAAFAVDEALTVLVGDPSIVTAERPPDAEAVKRRFSSLTRNRRRKHLDRARLVTTAARHRVALAADPATRTAGDVDAADLLSHLRVKSDPTDWRLVERAAAGETSDAGRSAGAVRVRLHRARERIRAAA